MRQYLSACVPDKNGLLTVQGKDYRYMKQVLRLAVGDMVQVRLPDGALQCMTVCNIDEHARTLLLQICAQPQEVGQPNSAPYALLDIWLFQFVAKSAKMDSIVRQATECGVSTIVPVLGAFSQAHGAEKNFRSERFLRIIKEARQQSGSAIDTRILEAVTVAQGISLWQNYCAEASAHSEVTDAPTESFAAVLYERSEHTVPLHAAVANKLIRRAALAVGAEGGISPSEIELLQQNGFVPIHFKTNILRCETAALYGIAALQNAITENDIWQCKE